jgi:hypothetical protein
MHHIITKARTGVGLGRFRQVIPPPTAITHIAGDKPEPPTRPPHARIVRGLASTGAFVLAATLAACSSGGGLAGATGSRADLATTSVGGGTGAQGGGTNTSPSLVNGQIQGATSGPGADHFSDVLTIATAAAGPKGAVNTLWAADFPQFAGQQWTNTVFVPYHTGQPACGLNADKAANNAFYCSTDDKV